jgi:hypothetical protein
MNPNTSDFPRHLSERNRVAFRDRNAIGKKRSSLRRMVDSVIDEIQQKFPDDGVYNDENMEKPQQGSIPCSRRPHPDF